MKKLMPKVVKKIRTIWTKVSRLIIHVKFGRKIWALWALAL